MSSVSGEILYNLTISDSTTLPTKNILKTVTLVEETTVSAGIVAVISGTVGTAAVSIGLDPTTYRDASGDTVSFTSTPTRISMQASGSTEVRLVDLDIGIVSLHSRNGLIASSSWADSAQVSSGMSVQASGGTNSYTIVVLKEE